MPPSVVPVRLRFDRWKLELTPCVVRLDPDVETELEFGSADGEMSITFIDGSPFEASSFASRRGAPVRSGRARSGLTAGTRFPYELVLRSGLDVEVRVRGLVLVAPGASSVPKLVRILRNPDGTIYADPDRVSVRWKTDERVEWICEFGTLLVNFDKGDGSPFKNDSYTSNRGERVRSGEWISGSKYPLYKYTVTVWIDGEGDPIILDPGVTVDDGGGDDGLSGGT